MQIRTRLALQFILLGGAIIVIASVAIYISSANFRRDDFNHRLMDKAISTTNLLFNTDKASTEKILGIQNESSVFLQNEKIIILNFKNDTVYSSDRTHDLKIRNNIVERVRQGYIVTYFQNPYNVLVTLYFTEYDRFVVISAAIDYEGNKHLEKLRTILSIVCLSSLILFFVGGWFYSGRALKPISRVIRKVENISITSLNLRVDEGNGTDEIGRLARTFNNMLERLETSFAMQKNFIANASHELRTPLTSINGQLEVLAMKDRSGEEYKKALNSVLDDLKSLINLANRLLLIARTSAEGPVNFNKKVRIDEIIWQAREDTIRFNPGYSVNISMDDTVDDSDQMLVVGDDSLLKVAASNLIDNACKYSSDHSVNISFSYTGKTVKVNFDDHGIGIHEEDLRKIFEPFYRGVNTISFRGTGLGLSLVNQIIKNHNGEVKIKSIPGKGTSVTICLPCAV